MKSIWMPSLNRYRLVFQAEVPMRLSSYTGSAWRGLLGHGLRRVSCVTRARDCNGCPVRSHCIYASIFETTDIKSGGGRFRNKPHPFILTVPNQQQRFVDRGGKVSIEIALIGKAIEALPYLVQAMGESGKLGIGRDHAQFSLADLEMETELGKGDWDSVYDTENGRLECIPDILARIPSSPKSVLIELITPLRMKRKGRLVGPREFKASDFMRQLWRRTQDIGHFYGDESPGIELSLPENQAESLDKGAELGVHWHDWTRYSSRQRSKMQMGGLTGHIVLQGDALDSWWPILWFSQWLHLGKATSMGLGQYQLNPLQVCRQGQNVYRAG